MKKEWPFFCVILFMGLYVIVPIAQLQQRVNCPGNDNVSIFALSCLVLATGFTIHLFININCTQPFSWFNRFALFAKAGHHFKISIRG